MLAILKEATFHNFYDHVVLPEEKRERNDLLPLIGANMGFSRSLFADQKFYDGFSRGDESAFKSALVKNNRDFKFITCNKAIVYNAFPSTLVGWTRLFYREGFNRRKISSLVENKPAFLEKWVLIGLVLFLLCSIAVSSFLLVSFLLIFLSLIFYLISNFSIFQKRTFLGYYRTIKLTGRICYVLKSMFDRNEKKLKSENGKVVTYKKFNTS